MKQVERDLSALKATIRYNSDDIITCDGCQHLIRRKGAVAVIYSDRSNIEHGGNVVLVNTKYYSPACAPSYHIVWVWPHSNREMEFYIREKNSQHGIETLKRITI